MFEVDSLSLFFSFDMKFYQGSDHRYPYLVCKKTVSASFVSLSVFFLVLSRNITLFAFYVIPTLCKSCTSRSTRSLSNVGSSLLFA